MVSVYLRVCVELLRAWDNCWFLSAPTCRRTRASLSAGARAWSRGYNVGDFVVYGLGRAVVVSPLFRVGCCTAVAAAVLWCAGALVRCCATAVLGCVSMMRACVWGVG